MKFKDTYKVLSKQIFKNGDYSLVPIRAEDRFDIMKWRNEQMYHLRQNKVLTNKDQNTYFTDVISNLFTEDHPKQVLFSLLKNDKCIGYGGLVHINWIDKNAEISFIMDTQLEINEFEENWRIFLKLIEIVGFEEMCLHKLNTYAFSIRHNLFPIIEKLGYRKDAVLKEHCYLDKKFIDVIIHFKLNINYDY